MENNGLDTVVDITAEEAADSCQAAEPAETVTEVSAEEAEAEARRDAEKAYLTRLDTFRSGYLRLVVAVFIGALAGIALAIHMNLWLGIGVAVFAATAYVYFASSDCRRLLGIVYKNENGSIIIEQALLRRGSTVVIPDRLIWADVTELADKVFVSSRNAALCRVYIPKSIKRMGENLLGEDGKTVTFLYEGSPEEWEEIEKQTDLSGCTVVFNVPFPRLPKKSKSRSQRSGHGKGAGR